MKAIETRYKGHRFRSRTEARWAVFLDALGVPWDYEPEGFDLSTGPYLPDFWLPKQQVWLEIKGGPPTAEEVAKAEALASVSGFHVFILPGAPEVEDDVLFPGGLIGPKAMAIFSAGEGATDIDHDAPYFWTQCPHCHEVGVTHQGRIARLLCCLDAAKDDHSFNSNSLHLLTACAAATEARFEHGETGAPGWLGDLMELRRMAKEIATAVDRIAPESEAA